jgi:Mn2+/Fe2+ NRAMP family transporter
MGAIQEICDRTALATGKGLGALAQERFAKRGRVIVGVLLVALVVANAFNVAADLVAVGSGMQLLGLGSKTAWAVVAGVGITALLVTGSFNVIANAFKVLCLVLFAYIVELAMVNVRWGDVLVHTIVPHVQLTKPYMALLVALLGTTISPYLFFWQTAHRVEQLREEPVGGRRAVGLLSRSKRVAKRELKLARFDVFSGMALSNAVMFSIIVVTSSTLHAKGQLTVSSPAAAAKALQPVAGHLSSAVFALGFIGSGLLAVPVLAGAGSAGLAGLLGRQEGFSRSPRQAPTFYALVAAGTLGGAALTLVGGNPITLLVLAAAINGVAAAPFLVIVMLIADDQKLMGRYVNGRAARVLGWATAALMAAAAVGLAVFR